MIDPQKPKYHKLYWSIAFAAAKQSTAQRKKVGAVIVTPTGMISVGWNGMPAGFDNNTEVYVNDLSGPSFTTRPEVIHAERNAIDKLTRQGVPVDGSILFITLSPCLECAKSIHGLGFEHIYYEESYRDSAGLDFLKQAKVPFTQKPRNLPYDNPY